MQIKSVNARKLPQQTVLWHKTNHQAGSDKMVYKTATDIQGVINTKGETMVLLEEG